MDDVYTVIGLLLFGSFLFCLCCYKVSNLLYMLYHIDDNTPDEEPDFSSILMKEAGANPTGPAAQAAYSFVNTGNAGKELGGLGAAENGIASAKSFLTGSLGGLNFPTSSTEHLLIGNHVGNHILGNSGGVGGGGIGLEGGTYRMKTAGSVTSLSVGVQCTPGDSDVRTSSETCLIPSSS